MGTVSDAIMWHLIKGDLMCGKKFQFSRGLPCTLFSVVMKGSFWPGECIRQCEYPTLTYASQAWWGSINEGEKSQLGAIIAKAVKQGFLTPDQLTFQEICDSADLSLFRSILQNPSHVLHQLLPPVKIQNYSFRERAHNREIPFTKSVIFRKTFIMKMLYLESY